MTDIKNMMVIVKENMKIGEKQMIIIRVEEITKIEDIKKANKIID